ncbi:MAG: C-terminal binding protein [Pseudomonadota bacterium]
MKPSVLMTDTIFPDTSLEQEVFAEEGIEFTLSPSQDVKTLAESGKSADALLVVYASVGADIIEQLEHCKVIVRAGIGYNNVDLEAASRKGIRVANVPDYCQGEVADHTLGIFLALARRICHLNQRVKEGNWNANEGKSAPRLQGKTFGLLGCGAIGQEVAQRAMAFGLEVVAYDPYASPEALSQHGIRKIEDIDQLYREADFLSLHLPLTESTKHIIDRTALSKMKRSAMIINTSRGGLIEENDLYTALIENRIAGAAIDVLETEPPQSTPALFGLDNVIITPHTAFLSQDSVAELRKKASLEVARTLRLGTPAHPVN